MTAPGAAMRPPFARFRGCSSRTCPSSLKAGGAMATSPHNLLVGGGRLVTPPAGPQGRRDVSGNRDRVFGVPNVRRARQRALVSRRRVSVEPGVTSSDPRRRHFALRRWQFDSWSGRGLRPRMTRGPGAGGKCLDYGLFSSVDASQVTAARARWLASVITSVAQSETSASSRQLQRSLYRRRSLGLLLEIGSLEMPGRRRPCTLAFLIR